MKFVRCVRPDDRTKVKQKNTNSEDRISF